MDQLKKYFKDGVDGLLDDAVKAIVKPIEETMEFAEFLVFVMSMGCRRLKALFSQDEMTEEERKTPEFKLEAIPSLTDEEIKTAFYPLSPMDKAKFVLAVRKADGPMAIRFNALLEQMKSSEQAMRAENQAAIARRAQEDADRARQAADEAETKRVRRDDEALAFIVQAPKGRFQTATDIDGLIKSGENGDEVFDWVNRKEILVGDAMVVGKCLITDKKTAERLAEKLRRPKDKNRPLAFTIATTRAWLAQCELEREAVWERRAEEEREAQAAHRSYMAAVQAAFAAAHTIPDKELVRNQLKAGVAGADWKFEVIRREAEAREQEIFEISRQQLRERFPHRNSPDDIGASIREMEGRFLARSSEEQWPDNVIAGAEREVNFARRHQQWLADNPAGVRKPAPQADVINFADRWESSAGRERPKFGPGSGLGNKTRRRTLEEEQIHRGRQLAFGDRNYWTKKFDKTVEKFTDDDFKKVVELFGGMKGERKAAKKKGQGGHN